MFAIHVGMKLDVGKLVLMRVCERECESSFECPAEQLKMHQTGSPDYKHLPFGGLLEFMGLIHIREGTTYACVW